MKSFVDCIPCFFKQTIEAGKILGLSDEQIKGMIDAVSREIPGFSLDTSPPAMAGTIYRIIKEITGNPDPYNDIKKKSNELALEVYPLLKEAVKKSENSLQQAVQTAISGNIIDYGAIFNLDLKKELAALLHNNHQPGEKRDTKYFAFSRFTSALQKAKTLLYLGDNAGEIVFDKILIEEIKTLYPRIHIFFAVRGEPIINDVLIEDAKMCGIDTLATLISNGSNAPGTILETCSGEFKEIWSSCDMIISKGQGNYESISKPLNKIFFMFIVKCQVLARDIGCDIRQAILYNKE
jgi:damage-control phosphatase, subfamily I